jgi:hypothetical protein
MQSVLQDAVLCVKECTFHKRKLRAHAGRY